MRFSDAINIEDLRAIARRRLPRFVFDYVDGGAEDERTLTDNRAAFARLRFRPRTLVDVSRRDLSAPLLGQPASMPAVVGPTGLNGLCWRDGDLALARAAAAAGLPFAMSTVSMSFVEDVAREAPGRHWLQAYVFSERRITEGILRRALEAGFECAILTSDFPVAGKRERDLRTGLLPAQRFTLATKIDMLAHPRWIATVATRRPRFVNVERELGPGRDVNAFVGHGMFDPSFSWDDVRRFRDTWPRKLLLKGVLRADDAERAVAAGFDGIVLSNHGGRQLDGAVTGLDALPEVARAVGARASILVDGGVRRGGDIARAVALGAEGVLLGRAPVYGLAAGGQSGVERALAILAEELDRTLALTGCTGIGALGPDLLAPA
ncbi:MAG TPA: alpha-hydroxy acid oxidase [Steroidobacteraceae bacterium]|jgi:(S)-mandelate dehydrogenase|nr:alpha-hydroxy acid oxidase [Steroidobacteraceae bacterium]